MVRTPSASTTTALTKLAVAGNAQAFIDSRSDLKALSQGLFNWVPGADPGSTKAVIRALRDVLEEEATYCAGVEALSFVAAAGPLLDPNRIAQMITDLSAASTSYAPIRYPAKLTSQLQYLLGHFPTQRADQLLRSLWRAAHQPNWWEATLSSPEFLSSGAAKRRRKARSRTAVAAAEALILGDTASVSRAIAEGVYSQGTVPDDIVWEFSDENLKRIALTQDKPQRVEPLCKIWLSQVTNLAPQFRPESPVVDLVNILVERLGDETPKEVFAKKPKEWTELYPDESLTWFDIPAELKTLEGICVPGTGEGTEFPRAELRWVPNTHLLEANGAYMGNCTFSHYANRCISNDGFIARITYDGEGGDHNTGWQKRGGVWSAWETAARHNNRAAPEINEGVRKLLDLVNDA